VVANERKILRCAVYTRKSSEHGLEQDFNSLDAQREAAEAYIKSQAHEGWKLIKTHYADGGLSGGTLQRPALQSLLGDIRTRKIDVVVVYKVDRLTRSLADFAKLVELFEAHGVSFVSVTQQFNTTTSMGRLTLNVLLSFAQFEREIAGERIRDKFAASRRKGMWMGGTIPLGYDVQDRKLIINDAEAETVRLIFQRYLALGCVSRLRVDLDRNGVRSKQRILTSGRVLGGCSFGRGALYHLLRNRIYRGEVVHKGIAYPGEHEPIVKEELWIAVQARLATSRNASRPGSKAALFSPVSSSTIAVTGCLRPIRCVGETATAITSVRRTCGAARQVRDPASVPMM
jgi:DNA invertase Pin-like site-specific DNA recombinase